MFLIGCQAPRNTASLPEAAESVGRTEWPRIRHNDEQMGHGRSLLDPPAFELTDRLVQRLSGATDAMTALSGRLTETGIHREQRAPLLGAS